MAVAVADVRQVYATTRNDANVQQAITDATLLVTEVLNDSGLSSTRLDLITKYLAAHFLVLADRGGVTSEKLGEAVETYDVGKGASALLSSPFGSTAASLDTTGRLAASQANGGLKAQFSVI